MNSAFVLVAARPGRSLPDAVRRWISRPQVAGLPFVADDHVCWADANDRHLVGAWQRQAGSSGSRWVVRDDGLTVSTGRLRHRGTAWTEPGRWAGELADSLASVPTDELVADLTGAFTFLHLDAAGRGAVACDAMGFGFLYLAERDDVVVVSSRAALAAWAANHGRPPAKDVMAAAWLPYTSFTLDGRTGFDGVQLLPESTVVELAPDAAPRVHEGAAPWLRAASFVDLDPDEVLDRVTAEIADELRAALAIPAEERYIDLTGGKDSRLVLAVALSEGLADEFTFRTIGPPDLSDVRVASSVAERFGLRHRTGVRWPGPQQPYLEQVTRFVDVTTGTVNMWDMKGNDASPPEVRVSGMTGECLRAHVKVWKPSVSNQDVADVMRRRLRRGLLDLLDPEVSATLEATVTERLLDDPVGGSDPLDLLGTFNIRTRARMYRGPMDELERDIRLWALCGLESVRGAYALGPRRRQEERVHFEIMRRYHDDLAFHPFAGPGWAEGVLEEVAAARADVVASRSPTVARPSPVPPTPEHEVPLAVPPPRAGKKDEPLIARMRRRGSAWQEWELRKVMYDDGTNALWDVVDRDATIAALDQWSSLTARQQRQLYATATSLIWLAS